MWHGADIPKTRWWRKWLFNKSYDLDNIIKQALRKFAAQFIRKEHYFDIPLNYQVITDENGCLW